MAELKSSGWMNVDAINWIECPRCKVLPGRDCRTPKGRKYYEVHAERTAALSKLPDFDMKNYQRSESEAKEVAISSQSEMIEVKCDVTYLMLQAAREMHCVGVSIGFTVATQYLIRIAKRAIDLKDEELIRLCKNLCLLK